MRGASWWSTASLGGVLLLVACGVSWAQGETAGPYRHLATVTGQTRSGAQFVAPWDVAVDSEGFIYVTDIAARNVIKLNPDHQRVASVELKAPPNALVVVGGPDRSLRAPMGVCVRGNKVYVTDGDDVAIFDRDLVFVGVESFLTPSLGWASGVEAKPGFFENDTLYVADVGRHRIYHLALQDESSNEVLIQMPGTAPPSWGGYGHGNGEFASPCAIASAPDGSAVYVLDSDNHRVQRFTVDGTYAGQWGEQGTGPGQLQRPEGIAVRPDGSVIVADTDNHRIECFSADGEYQWRFGTRAGRSAAGGFRGPHGVAVDSEGNLYVCDTGNGALKIYAPRPIATQIRPGLRPFQQP